MNWAKRILFLYLGFVALIAALVTMSMRQKTDLVAKDYYAQEIAYQDKLNKMNRARALDEPVKWTLHEGKLQLEFPTTVPLPVSGTVTLFCASDSEKDRKLSFTSSQHSCELALPATSTGLYTLQLDWKAGDQTYYQEGVLQLP